MISNLGFNKKRLSFFCDNLSTVYLAKVQVYHERIKHNDIIYQFIHFEKRFKVLKFDMRENSNDMFMKPIP